MLMLVMAILMPYEGAWAQTPTPPSKGDGKKDSPYIITKAEELAWFRNQVNSGQYSICAKIADNVEVIDMSTVCHAADKSQNLEEKSWVPIGNRNIIKYRGTFDGNGKTITNLYINASQTSQNNMGLFGYTYQSTIKNLTFENANVTNTQSNTGILVGKAGYGSTLQNIKISKTCQIKGGNYTGGIAGELDGNAYNCVNYATVQGIQYIGGLCGHYSSSRTGNSMTACANYGNVTATSQRVGGLVGDFSSGTIQDCANYGNVKGANSVAGMAGFVDKGKIQNVFSYGSISATNGTEVGMVLGYSKYGATEGMVAYYSGAKLTANSQEITVKAFGSGNLSEDNATGFTETQLKSGVVAYQLQQNASNGAKWGQNLADSRDQYPVPGSDNKVIKAAQGDKDANGNDTYWATFSNLKNDVTLSVPSDRTLKVYNATVSGGKMTLTERNSQVAKDEGVLLKTDGEYVNAKANETNELTKASSDENHLVATPAEAQTVTAETGCKLYRLTYKNATNKERLGFYLSVDKANNSSNGTSLKATPGKAYLQVNEDEAKDPSSAALARSFVFGGGNETTGIEGITIMGTDVQRHGTIEGIFDLQGRKISNPTKGIYIKNNKKVVIK
ncbi:hypothetical protein [Segatella copri]|uniref:hypothetical protein n=1 Tax=Segatella copri TaxID=165179 RepID=UPI002939FAE3|nr:hypothetical protein [Segatella copri]MDV3105762.1 hypothetical protein [Segatella copri]WOF88520.1 hypothetical protein RJT05_04045 [Segatella copri]WOG32897.1 hypothetical protein RJT04_04545 [Segatella copri]